MPQTANGKSKATISILISVIVLGLGAAVTTAVNGYFYFGDKLNSHCALPGHPVMKEKVDRVEQDISEIKSDVREIKKMIFDLTPR